MLFLPREVEQQIATVRVPIKRKAHSVKHKTVLWALEKLSHLEAVYTSDVHDFLASHNIHMARGTISHILAELATHKAVERIKIPEQNRYVYIPTENLVKCYK